MAMTSVPKPVACEWISTGREFFTWLLRSINEARVSIRLEVYILTPDAIGRAVASALTLAALRGVEVHVLLDGLGSSAIPPGFWDDLTRAGGQVRWFNASEFRRLPIRNHRKLVVVDDRVAGVGGFNIAEEYSGDGVEQGWADVGLAITGEAVPALARDFDRMWVLSAEGPRWRNLLGRGGRVLPKAIAPDVQLLASGPGPFAGSLQRTLREDWRSARDILLVVAYFLPGRGIRRWLRGAAARGARVRIVVPGRSDVPIARRAARHLYTRFLRSRIEILEYQPQILHAKLYLTEHSVFVGSSNLDTRSLHINHEVMLRVTQSDVVRRGWRLAEDLVARSRAVDLESWVKTRTLGDRLKDQFACWILSRFDPWATRWIARDPR